MNSHFGTLHDELGRTRLLPQYCFIESSESEHTLSGLGLALVEEDNVSTLTVGFDCINEMCSVRNTRVASLCPSSCWFSCLSTNCEDHKFELLLLNLRQLSLLHNPILIFFPYKLKPKLSTYATRVSWQLYDTGSYSKLTTTLQTHHLEEELMSAGRKSRDVTLRIFI